MSLADVHKGLFCTCTETELEVKIFNCIQYTNQQMYLTEYLNENVLIMKLCKV
jgi:hypothetical protein